MSIPGLTTDQLKLVKEIVTSNNSFKLFGSRVKGNYRINSDIDICVLSDIPRSEVTKINEQFEESNLPFTVDVVLYRDCNDAFKKIINDTGIEL